MAETPVPEEFPRPPKWPFTREQANQYIAATNAQLDQDRARDLQQLQKIARRLLGDRFEELFTSKDATVKAIVDPDPKIRRGALFLVCHHWKPVPELEDTFRDMALSDPDFKVRADAIRCWVWLHLEDKDRAISTVLAGIARNESLPAKLRGTAYLGLLNVQGIEVPIELMEQLFRSQDALPE